MVLWMACGYLILAALFYLGLTAMAGDVSVPPRNPHPKWQRARRMKDRALFRRIRPLLALRSLPLPKRRR